MIQALAAAHLVVHPAFSCCFGLLGLAIFIFWIWMLIDAIQNQDGNTRIVWVLVIVLTGILGAIIYFFLRGTTRR